jgi:hypothetical protein
MRTIILLFFMGTLAGCMSVSNVTYVWMSHSDNSTLVCDGGSQAKPIDVGRGLTATVPLAGM